MAAGYENNAYGQNYATGGGARGGGGGGGAGAGVGAGGFFSNSQSPGGGGAGGARSASTLTMRPVTVRQILNSQQIHTDGEITIDGLEVGHVTFVGIIRNLSRNATNISYNIEDGTGMIDVRTWSDNSASSLMSEDEYQTDHYVRVIGSVKNFNGRRTVNAGHIRLVKDFNEIFYHKLESIHVHLLITRGPNGGVKSESQDDTKMEGADIYGQFTKPIQHAVIKAVQDSKHDDNGVAIDVIVRRIAKFREAEIRETIDELIGEGVFYTGLSDEFICSTI